jgi:hypothetical protein
VLNAAFAVAFVTPYVAASLNAPLLQYAKFDLLSVV